MGRRKQPSGAFGGQTWSSALHVDSDHLLRATEAAERLGFAVVAQGDIMLKATHQQELERAVAQKALELEFPCEEADRQLDAMVDWGRYAERLAYDDARQAFYLEPAAEVTR